MAKIFASANPEMSEREKRNMVRSRKIAGQGMVLLKNNGVLPLEKEVKTIALFGNGARRTIKGGTGSGDVNSRFVINIEQGLEEGGFTITSKNWLNRYDEAVNEAKNIYFNGVRAKMAQQGMTAIMELFDHPFQDPAVVPITEEELKDSKADAAIYVISRNSGEGKDRDVLPGDYNLYPEEEAGIRKLAEAYEDIILILNTGGVIDTRVIRSIKQIGAILQMSQAGNIGGYAPGN